MSEKRWYNAERKEQFLKDKGIVIDSQDASTWKMIFANFYDIEMENQKDICELSPETLQKEVTRMFGIRLSSTHARFRQIRIYITWCAEQGFLTTDLTNIKFKPVDDVMIEKVQQNLVSSPQHLQKVLDEIFNSEELNSIDVILRTYLWLAFIGFDEKEALKIKADDVKLDTQTITFENEKYEIYNESIIAFKKAKEITRFDHNRYANRALGDTLLRRTDQVSGNDGVKQYQIYISQKMKASNPTVKINFQKVRQSGIFYKAHLLEQEGELHAMWNAEVRKALKDETIDIDDPKLRAAAIKGMEKAIIKPLRQNYKYWKAAYYPEPVGVEDI